MDFLTHGVSTLLMAKAKWKRLVLPATGRIIHQRVNLKQYLSCCGIAANNGAMKDLKYVETVAPTLSPLNSPIWSVLKIDASFKMMTYN